MTTQKEWTIGKLLTTSTAYWRGCALQAGVRLGVFTALDNAQLNLSDLAVKLQSDERGTELMGVAPQLASQIDLKGRKLLLDLGGGPGTYAIHFCMANPELKAVIYDRQTTEPFASKTVKKFNLTKRINFEAGDFYFH